MNNNNVETTREEELWYTKRATTKHKKNFNQKLNFRKQQKRRIWLAITGEKSESVRFTCLR